MHHNPAKNVLWVSMLADEIAGKMGRDITDVLDLLAIARAKLNAERLKRPTPFIDKTIYTNWNALCISAYLHYARVTRRPDARHFALRSLDRILAEAWDANRGLSHVIAYSDPTAEKRFISGLLDDYAYTAIACLDAYEISGDFSYFRFAQQIADEMIRRFADPTSGGFFDTEGSLDDLRSSAHFPLAANRTRTRPRPLEIPVRPSRCCACTLTRTMPSISTRRKTRSKSSPASRSSLEFTPALTAWPPHGWRDRTRRSW